MAKRRPPTVPVVAAVPFVSGAMVAKMAGEGEVALDALSRQEARYAVEQGAQEGLDLRAMGEAKEIAEEGAAAMNAVPQAPATAFRRTEALSGTASRQAVAQIEASMRAKGWVGGPIEVLEHNGSLYVINGHHRLEGARRAGIDVPHRALTEAEIRAYGFSGIDQVIWTNLEVAPNKM